MSTSPSLLSRSRPSRRARPLFCPPGVYRPDDDSRLLAAHVAGEPLAHQDVLDLCTGSGFVARAACEAGARSVLGVDASWRAVISARVNLRASGRARVMHGDLLAAVRGRRFDLITANPPYVPEMEGARRRSAAWDAGADGRATIDRICAQAAAHLTPHGALLMVHSEVAAPADTLAELRRTGLQARVVATRRVALGPVLTERRAALRRRGLLSEDDSEQLVVIRAERPGDAP